MPLPAPALSPYFYPPPLSPFSALLQLMLEIIAVRLWNPAPMPRHLLQTLSRLGHNDRRCMWYYANYGRSSAPYDGSSSSAATATGGGNGGGGGGVNGEEVFVVVERKPEWDKVYVLQSRGGIRVGFQTVSAARPCQSMMQILAVHVLASCVSCGNRIEDVAAAAAAATMRQPDGLHARYFHTQRAVCEFLAYRRVLTEYANIWHYKRLAMWPGAWPL